jgi:hypothetical protein
MKRPEMTDEEAHAFKALFGRVLLSVYRAASNVEPRDADGPITPYVATAVPLAVCGAVVRFAFESAPLDHRPSVRRSLHRIVDDVLDALDAAERRAAGGKVH